MSEYAYMDEATAKRFGMAIAFAAKAHAMQVYKGQGGRPDQPYIFHTLRVAAAVSGKRERIVAVLHDTKEDAGIAPPWLDNIEAAALDLLTRDKTKGTYADYIVSIRDAEGEAGRIAREVKIADLRENLSHCDGDSKRERYVKALGVLLPATSAYVSLDELKGDTITSVGGSTGTEGSGQ